MKKLFVLALSIFCAITVEAQNGKFSLNKITWGMVVAASGTTTFTNNKQPFVLSYNVCPNICFVTNKTCHNFLYVLGNNSIKNVNGYFINQEKDVNVYLTFSKFLSTKGGSVIAGIEKSIKYSSKTGDAIFFLFVDVQSNINHGSETKDFQFNTGVHINIQAPLYVKN